MSLLRIVFTTLGSTLAVVVAGFASGVVLARALGPEGRGAYAAIVLVATLAASIGQLGLGQAFVYSARRYPAWKPARAVLWGLLAVLLATAVMASGLARGLLAPAAWATLLVAAALAMAQSAQTFVVNCLQLDVGLTKFNFLRVAQPWLALLMVALLAGLQILTVEVAAGVLVVTSVFAAATGIYFFHSASAAVSKEAGTAQSPTLGSVLKYGIKYHLTTLVGVVVQNLDKVVLSQAQDLREFGLYALAYNFSRLMASVQEAAATTLFSRYAGRQSDQLPTVSAQVFRITLLPMLLVAATVGWLLPKFFTHVYGPAFSAAVLPCMLLLLEAVIGSASWLLAQRFAAEGRPGLVFVRQALSLLPLGLVLLLPWHQPLSVRLATGMLLAALVRLWLTLVIYPLVLGERVPRLLPNQEDFRMLRDLVAVVRRH